MTQDLCPGELPLHHEAFTCLDNLRHNLRLRQQRADGFGYLLDAEAEWLLQHVSCPVYAESFTDDCERDGDDDIDDEVFFVETAEGEVGENSRGDDCV